MFTSLPQPVLPEESSLQRCLQQRRSVRTYSNGALTLSDMSNLLWAAQGMTGEPDKRTIPSAGAVYPLKVYALVRRVAALTAGLYEYIPEDRALKSVDDQPSDLMLSRVGIGDQPWLATAAVVIALCGDFERARAQFADQQPTGRRGDRYVYIESGAATQNVHLVATSLGLGCVLVAGMNDEQAKRSFELPSELEPIALMCIGPTAGR